MASSPDFSTSKESNIENVENAKAPEDGRGISQTRIDPAMRKRIVRKLDKRIIPCLMFMYLANYVDRTNVAAARVKGLQRDLGLNDLQYANVISLFFVTYVGLQVPITFGVAYVKKPTYFICGCMSRGPEAVGQPANALIPVLWGAISTAAGAVHNYAGILAVRLTLGIAEAAFFPVALFTLSKFYTRDEMGLRATIYYTAALLAGALGSLLAAGIIDGTDGINGVAGWRYLFYIEGAITIAGGIVIAFILPNFPATASFLTEEERYWAVRRLVDDSGRVDEHVEGEKWFAPLVAAFKEPVLYLLALCIWTLTAGVSFNQYSPTLTASLGFKSTEALLLTAPPYFYTMLLALANSWHSDRKKERSWHIIGPMIPACVGVIIPLATTNVAARYVGIFLMTGAYAAYTVLLSWLPAAFPGYPRRRAVAVAFLAAFSNTANIAGGYFFRADRFGPTYRGSFAIILAMYAGCAVMAYVVRLYLIRKNKQLDRAEELLAQSAGLADDALVQKTAQTQGISFEEAANLKASYRFYI